MSGHEGILVGGEPEAVLAAGSFLHDVAFRTDDVARRLVEALGAAATTIAVTAPFAPAKTAAAKLALDNVLVGPSGLGQVATTYGLAGQQARAAGQALELAGVVVLVGSGTLARLQGRQATVLPRADGIDVRREAMSLGAAVGPGGHTGTVSVRQVQRQNGSTIYVVELVSSYKVGAAAGAQVNGFGGYADGATGPETTLRWAVASRDEAELLVSQVALGVLPLAAESLPVALPEPTETTISAVSSAAAVGSPLLVPLIATGNLSQRHELTERADGGRRLALTISGTGSAGLPGAAGAGGAASARVAVERDGRGVVTKLTLSTTTEVDRGRSGFTPVDALNREAVVEEQEWELQLTPELRARADRVADALAGRQAPDQADLRALSDAVAGVDPTVRTYDVRHQQLAADSALPGLGGGGSVAVDTARLRALRAPLGPSRPS